MNAVKGRYDDGTGDFTKHGEPNRAWAIKILYDEAYLREKAKIMGPIDDFFAMLDASTRRTTAKYERLIIRIPIIIIAKRRPNNPSPF